MLRRLLLLNLLPFVAMLLATGVYAITLFSRLATSVDAAVGGNYRSVVAAQQMHLALAGMDREAWAAAASPSGVAKSFGEYQKRFEANLALQLKSNSLPGERDLNGRLVAIYAAYCHGLAELSAVTNPKMKYRVYDLEIVPPGLEMRALLDKILNLNQRAILAASERVRQITHNVTRLMVIGMIVALAFSAYACYQLTTSVLRPIKLVTKATRELGDGNLMQPVPVLSRDELGQLALAFNKMASQLQEYRQSTTEEVVRLHRTMETTLG
ncbi:MAG TPA: HAMP domain-containing protein, partial [Dongiaceae bacterium]|nr:HAMP domain-containing protein [Dongiaceae bacterium]